MTSKKISNFTGQAAFEQTDDLVIVRSNANYRVPFSAAAAALGVTGSLNIVGGTGTAVLEQPSSTVNNIRNLEPGNGISISLSASNGITLKHNFTVDSTGEALIVDANIPSPVIKSLVPGAGISIVSSGATLTVSQTAGAGGVINVVTANHTTIGDETVICNNSGSIDVTLDLTPNAGDTVTVQRSNSPVDIIGAINGLSKISLANKYDSLQFKYINATLKWVVI